MTALIGQQSSKNRKTTHEIKGTKYIANSSKALERAGLALSDYISGLNSSEFVTSFIVTRDGALGSVVKVKSSGYAERRPAHTLALQELAASNDYTARNSPSEAMQFEHPRNSIDTRKLADS